MALQPGNHLARSPRLLAEETVMLLIIALLLFVVFGGLGFIAHVLWLGLLLAVGVFIFHLVSGRGARA